VQAVRPNFWYLLTPTYRVNQLSTTAMSKQTEMPSDLTVALDLRIVLGRSFLFIEPPFRLWGWLPVTTCTATVEENSPGLLISHPSGRAAHLAGLAMSGPEPVLKNS
jgi:hypothetical protein